MEPEELVERYLQGETQVCERLLSDQQHCQRVDRLAKHYTQRTSISREDAAQEAQDKVLQAARNGEFSEGGVEDFYSWAAAVAENAIRDRMLECYLQGDKRACDRLLIDQEYRQRVERFARYRTQGTSISWEDAAQAAQENVLQAARSGGFREGGVEKFYSWAARVAKNAIIDQIRRECRQGQGTSLSLDEPIPGTNMTLGEIIAYGCDLWDLAELVELARKVPEIVQALDRDYPTKRYLQLWQGMLAEQTQCKLAKELGVGQSEVSKRQQELLVRIREKLGFLTVEQLQKELRSIRGRRRSDSKW